MSVRAGVAAIAMAIAVPLLAPALAQEPCQPTDTSCLRQALRGHAVRRLDFWRAELEKPLLARIGAAPAPLVDYLTLGNLSNGYPQRPRPTRLEPDFLEDIEGALADLPPQVLGLFGERLAGVYFLEDLGGTGFTAVVADAAGRPSAGFIVLDAAVLRRLTANAWATWKEGTPFKPQQGYSLAARIEAGAGDNRRNAIQYILLHELGHVPAAAASYPYFKLSWSIDREANRYAALSDPDFRQRRNIAYYFGAKLDAADMVATYDSLERTNFPSLYAATQPGDDFAEAFASYVHVVLQRRPWQILIYQDGKLRKEFGACWEEPRCAAKRALLEQMLGR